jgi:all-trans-retinol dehydrogenase (NAD+)
MKYSFRGKKVLVTGGASGIGKIMARKALEKGATDLVLWDINAEGLAQAGAELSPIGGRVHTYTVDISKVDEVQSAAQQTLSTVGPIDVLINNAGVVVGKNFHEHTHGDIERTMAINSSAPMHTTLEFLPAMLAQNSGAVCTIASQAALVANPKMSVYCASKWAAFGWSDSLRLEMKQLRKNIGVTTIAPYYINTGMFEGVKSPVIPILDPEKTSARILRAIEHRRAVLSLPLPFWVARLSQAILPLAVFDWVMEHVLGIYKSMNEFKGRETPTL